MFIYISSQETEWKWLIIHTE